MPTVALLPPLLAAVLATSILSGIFGMAGGLILMGVYAWLLPVGAAMVLHGFTQAIANGFRWWLLRERTDWRGVRVFMAGSCLAAALLSAASFVPDRATLFIFLGAVPFAAAALPRRLALDFTRRPVAFLGGILITLVQLTAGVAGPLLDVLFVRAPLGKEAVVATKAFTQTLSHLLKLAYYALLLRSAPVATDVGASGPALACFLLAVAALALAGTWLGARVLSRLDERLFRSASRGIVLAIGAVYLVQGARLLFASA